MAERKVNAKDILLFIDVAGGTNYQVVVCLTEQSFNLATEVIDSATKCGADKAPGNTEYTLDFQGQTLIGEGTKVSAAVLFTLAQNSTTIGWKIGKAVPVTGDVSYEGQGFISKLDQSWPNTGKATFSASVGIEGVPTQTITA